MGTIPWDGGTGIGVDAYNPYIILYINAPPRNLDHNLGVHVPHNQVLGILVVVILVQVLGQVYDNRTLRDRGT